MTSSKADHATIFSIFFFFFFFLVLFSFKIIKLTLVMNGSCFIVV